MTSYDIVSFAAMLADTGRTQAYARALEARVTPGAIVLDIGTGSGVFALQACRAGAARVYAIEPDDIIDVAHEMARANELADRITFVQALSTSIDLPEPVDGIVADLRGSLPLFREAVHSILDARARFLKPGGWIVAERDTMYAAVAASPLVGELMFGDWQDALGLDASAVSRRARFMGLRHRVAAEDLLTPPQPWAVLDYRTQASPDVSGEASWTMNRGGIGHGLSIWFDCETAPGIGFTNSPASGEEHVYGQMFLPWPEPAEFQAGDRVSVRFRADFVNADYLWAWNTQTECAGGGDVRRYSQSSFSGTTLSAERLRKRAHTFVPSPGEEARIDRRVLALMDRGQSLGGIAIALVEEFPHRFASYAAALTHAADLAERYAT